MNKRTKVAINESGLEILMKPRATFENTPFNVSVRFFVWPCICHCMHGVCSRGTWSRALDTGEGFSIKRQIFARAEQSLWYETRSRTGQLANSIWVTGALRSPCGSTCLVHTYMLLRTSCSMYVPGLSCAFYTCVASSRCGLEPLAQQVHLAPHLAKPRSATPPLLLCVAPFSPAGGSAIFFLMQK